MAADHHDYELRLDGETIGTLRSVFSDFPRDHCAFTPAPGFAAVRPLYEEERRVFEAWRACHDPAEKARLWEQMEDLLLAIHTRGVRLVRGGQETDQFRVYFREWGAGEEIAVVRFVPPRGWQP